MRALKAQLRADVAVMHKVPTRGVRTVGPAVGPAVPRVAVTTVDVRQVLHVGIKNEDVNFISTSLFGRQQDPTICTGPKVQSSVFSNVLVMMTKMKYFINILM